MDTRESIAREYAAATATIAERSVKRDHEHRRCPFKDGQWLCTVACETAHIAVCNAHDARIEVTERGMKAGLWP